MYHREIITYRDKKFLFGLLHNSRFLDEFCHVYHQTCRQPFFTKNKCNEGRGLFGSLSSHRLQ